MKIVFVCDTLGSGGAERVISNLSNKFVIKGHSVSIVMLSSEAKEPFYKLESQISLIYLAQSIDEKTGFFAKAKMLRKALEQQKPDIVISFLSYVCIYTWWALKKTRIPYIVSERNDPNQRSFIKQFLLNCSFKKAIGCVFQTGDACGWYKKVCKGKTEVIFNPVYLDYLPSNIGDIKRKKQILYVGRFTDQKNCLMLIDSFELFLKKHPDYILKMHGNGVLESEIKLKIVEKGLANNIVALPSSSTWQKDEYDSAMFVLPSKYEGMPNVLAETLCLGIPSVSTNCTIGGPKELKKIFPNQLVLSERIDSESFAKAMEEALNIECKGSVIPDELKIDVITDKWLSFINECLLTKR